MNMTDFVSEYEGGIFWDKTATITSGYFSQSPDPQRVAACETLCSGVIDAVPEEVRDMLIQRLLMDMLGLVEKKNEVQ